jgi:hypothetical protein
MAKKSIILEMRSKVEMTMKIGKTKALSEGFREYFTK